MLSKLFKHEFRASSHYYVPVYIATLIVSLVLGIVWTIELIWHNGLFDIIAGPFVFVLFMGVLMALSISAFLLPAIRFYKTMVSDEGYLTHTLPVTSNQLILSRLLVGATYYVFNLLMMFFIMAGAFFLNIIVTKEYETLEWAQLRVEFVKGMQEIGMDQISVPLFTVEMIIACILGIFSSVLITYTAIAMAQCMNGHKIVWTIVFYMCINIGFSMISGAISIIVMIGMIPIGIWNIETISPAIAYQISGFIGIIVTVIQLVIGYFVTKYLFTKRLNLE